MTIFSNIYIFHVTRDFLLEMAVGRFSEAGLLERMRFVIFRARSHEMSQRTSGLISE